MDLTNVKSIDSLGTEPPACGVKRQRLVGNKRALESSKQIPVLNKGAVAVEKLS